MVRHFAGNVCYQVDGFLSKNNDTLGDDFLEAMMASPNPILGSVAGAPATAPMASSKSSVLVSGGGGITGERHCALQGQ